MSFPKYDSLQLPVLKLNDMSFTLIDGNARTVSCLILIHLSCDLSQGASALTGLGWIKSPRKILVNYRSLRLKGRCLSFFLSLSPLKKNYKKAPHETQTAPPIPKLTEEANQSPICGISGNTSSPL